MAASVVGWTAGTLGNTSATPNTPLVLTIPSEIQDGDWMVLCLSWVTNGSITFDLAGWTNLRTDWESVGTYRSRVLVKRKETSETSVSIAPTNSPDAGSGVLTTAALFGINAGGEIADWTLGTPKSRATAPTETLTITCPSVTATTNDLVLSFGFERTTAFPDSVSWSGAAQVGFSPQSGNSSCTIAVGQSTPTVDGATSPVIITYNNSQSVNGWGYQLVIPEVLGVHVIGTPTKAQKTSGSSITLDKPAGVEDGDLLVAVIADQNPPSTVGDAYSSAGWSNLGPQPSTAVGTPGLIALGLAVPSAADLTATTFTFTRGSVGGRGVAVLFRVAGARISSLSTAHSAYATGTATTVSLPSLNVPDDESLLLKLIGTNWDSPNASLPSPDVDGTLLGWLGQPVDQSSGTSRTVLGVWQESIGAGTVSAETVTLPGTSTSRAGLILALAPVTAIRGLPVKYSDGTTLQDGHLLVSDGSGLVVPSRLRKVAPGYSSVSNMLSSSPFYVAHRGGSRSWPEMSLFAYVQASLFEYPALEVSVARSSDGVWFGLHDSSLDRTSLGSAGTTLLASALTWTDIQTHDILGSTAVDNPTQPDRPYARLEDILDAYAGDHVIFLDPKAASSEANMSELLDIMDSYPTPTDRFVAKYYGVSGNTGNTTGWAHAASQRGYQTWGYFYQADVPNLATYQGRWDILGMDYTADQASWDAIWGYDKPVIAHIIPNVSAIATAVSKINQSVANGIVTNPVYGFMVSGAAAVSPTSPVSDDVSGFGMGGFGEGTFGV